MAKKKKAKAKATKATKAGKKDVLVVASKVKNYIRSKDAMCSADAIQALSDSLYCRLDCAIERAKANRRTTVKPQDL
jgi:hypothetical protein